MRDLSKSLPRELVSILEPLLAYQVGDYSLRTSYKSKTSTLSISFDLGQKKKPLVKAPAKTKPQVAPTPALAPPAPRQAQKNRPPREKKTPPPVLDMEIETSLPTTPPPPAAALELAPLESRGEEPFRSPEGTGHGRKKRRDIPSPQPSPRPTTTTASTESQAMEPALNDSSVQTTAPQPTPLAEAQTQTIPVEPPPPPPPPRVKSFRDVLVEKSDILINHYKTHPDLRAELVSTPREQLFAKQGVPFAMIHKKSGEEHE
ncbi:formin-like protein 3 [Haliotis rufescens]|uniref:formin-like protein 3 n=1 Tax=Haliotis rufescens TaxID=6454 RepID=UPI00201EA8CC|nr:formin-like protein 3 [Haliotis rufescens]